MKNKEEKVGSLIKIENKGNTFFDPFENEVPIKARSNYIKDAIEIIVTVVEILSDGKEKLSEKEVSTISKVLGDMYDDYVRDLKKAGKDYDEVTMPTLREFYNRCIGRPEAVNLRFIFEKCIKDVDNKNKSKVKK